MRIPINVAINQARNRIEKKVVDNKAREVDAEQK
jgi:hypothetical protein